MNQLFLKAVKNDKYVSIYEFSPGVGADCGCICPECGEPVQSNVTGKTKEELKIDYTNHFSHVDVSRDRTCNGGTGETEIHLTAKRIIDQQNSIKVPGSLKGKAETIHYTNVRLEPAFPIENLKRYRPDIIVTTEDGKDLAIEVVVNSPVTEVKEQLYKDNELKSLIIDLSCYRKRTLSKVEFQLKYDVLKSITNKKWIWPELMDLATEIDVAKRTEEQKNPQKKNNSGWGSFLTFAALVTFTVILRNKVFGPWDISYSPSKGSKFRKRKRY